MNLQTAVAGDRAPLVELPHCNHVTVNKLQKTSFSATLFIGSCVHLIRKGEEHEHVGGSVMVTEDFRSVKSRRNIQDRTDDCAFMIFFISFSPNTKQQYTACCKKKTNQTRVLIYMCLISDRENVSGCILNVSSRLRLNTL